MAYVETRTRKFYFCELFLAILFPARPPPYPENSRQNGCSYEKSKAGWLAAMPLYPNEVERIMVLY